MAHLMAAQTPADTQLTRAPSRHRKQFTRHSPAGEVVIGYLARQAARLSALDMAVRRDKPDAVHDLRVTVRRTWAIAVATASTSRTSTER